VSSSPTPGVDPPVRRSPTTDDVHPDYGMRPFTKADTPYMDHKEKLAVRTAAFRAVRLYPGPVGDLLSRELLSWEELGVRLGPDKLIMQLIEHLVASPITDGGPEPGTAAPAPWRPGFPPWRRG